MGISFEIIESPKDKRQTRFSSVDDNVIISCISPKGLEGAIELSIHGNRVNARVVKGTLCIKPPGEDVEIYRADDNVTFSKGGMLDLGGYGMYNFSYNPFKVVTE